MQTYPQYYPQMNNYGQQYNPQQPYMDRLAGLQQYQQTLQQPQMAGIQMSLPNQPIGLNGKVVDTIEQITANDVPMDGSVAIFPKKDIQRRSLADLENTRKSSKASNSPAWKNFTGEMYKKTVLHRLCKHIELDFENPTQQSNFMAGMEIETDVSEIAHRKIAENENSQPFEVVADVEAKEEPSFVTEG